MSLTRKHYVMLAEALQRAQPISPYAEIDRWHCWEDAVHAIADALATDNPRFERERFIKAAEGDKE